MMYGKMWSGGLAMYATGMVTVMTGNPLLSLLLISGAYAGAYKVLNSIREENN
jgi:hypothetical protein